MVDFASYPGLFGCCARCYIAPLAIFDLLLRHLCHAHTLAASLKAGELLARFHRFEICVRMLGMVGHGRYALLLSHNSERR